MTAEKEFLEFAADRQEAKAKRDDYAKRLRKLGLAGEFTVGYETDNSGGRETYRVYLRQVPPPRHETPWVTARGHKRP